MESLRRDDPREVGPYRLEARLGGGGMGRVFLGRSRGGRSVAVKLVRPELADDPAFRRRFAQEVEAARLVGGFYTAQMVDADPDADPPWLVTAYIPGPSLHQAIATHGPLPAGTVTVLGAGLAEGLTAVHERGLVHRDLKPSNVILADDGPRIIDFGISRALDVTSHTQAVIGTPGFMSPEQARGREIGPASDVFSLACVLAYAATGRSPFGTGPAEAIVYRVVHDEPDLTDVPGHLADLVRRCLAKTPEDRLRLTGVLDELAAPARTPTRWLPPPVTTMITELLPTDAAARERDADAWESGATAQETAADAREGGATAGGRSPGATTGSRGGPPTAPRDRPAERGGVPRTPGPAGAAGPRRAEAAEGGGTAIAAVALAYLCLPGGLGMILMAFDMIRSRGFSIGPFEMLLLANVAILLVEAVMLVKGAQGLSRREAGGRRTLAVTAGITALHGTAGVAQFFLTGGDPATAAPIALAGVFVATPLTVVTAAAAMTLALLPATRRWCLPRP